MTREIAWIALGVAIIALIGILTMANAHDNHYKRRELQLLRSRVDGLERIVTGDHS